MKKSSAVSLLISGMLIAGCNKRPAVPAGTANWSYGSDGSLTNTNNTYVAGRGYWHAPYSGWYPYPYNFYRPGLGYYFGGLWHSGPDIYRPYGRSYGGSYGGGSSLFSGGGPSSSSTSGGSPSEGGHASVSRGGFGSSAHSGGGT